MLLYLDGVDEREGEVTVTVTEIRPGSSLRGMVAVSTAMGSDMDERLTKGTELEFNEENIFRWDM